jgi:hypothetical protein
MKNRLLVILLLIFTINEYAQYGPSPAFFRTQRAAPLVILNTTQTISVVDYGAIVNDGIDDLVAIQNAIQASVSIGTLLNPVRLEFENGTYDLKPDRCKLRFMGWSKCRIFKSQSNSWFFKFIEM